MLVIDRNRRKGLFVNEMRKNILFSLLLSSMITPVVQAGVSEKIRELVTGVAIVASAYYGYAWFVSTPQKKVGEDLQEKEDCKEVSNDQDEETLHTTSLKERAKERHRQDLKTLAHNGIKGKGIEIKGQPREQGLKKTGSQDRIQKTCEGYEVTFSLGDRFE